MALVCSVPMPPIDGVGVDHLDPWPLIGRQIDQSDIHLPIFGRAPVHFDSDIHSPLSEDRGLKTKEKQRKN